MIKVKWHPASLSSLRLNGAKYLLRQSIFDTLLSVVLYVKKHSLVTEDHRRAPAGDTKYCTYKVQIAKHSSHHMKCLNTGTAYISETK